METYETSLPPDMSALDRAHVWLSNSAQADWSRAGERAVKAHIEELESVGLERLAIGPDGDLWVVSELRLRGGTQVPIRLRLERDQWRWYH